MKAYRHQRCCCSNFLQRHGSGTLSLLLKINFRSKFIAIFRELGNLSPTTNFDGIPR